MLWDACGIPDYPKLSDGHHAAVVGEVFGFLVSDAGTVPADWFAGRLERLAHSEGDIATLSDRLAHARTCQYIANRSEWLEDPEHWRGRAREVEDAISDSLHARLVAQFVDRRGVSLARSHRRGGAADFRLQEDGVVEVEGESLGRFEGLRFRASGVGCGDPVRPRTVGPGGGGRPGSPASRAISGVLSGYRIRFAGGGGGCLGRGRAGLAGSGG